MMSYLTQIRWSPYAVGAGIGILSWFTFIFLKKPIGCSTAFARASGMIGKLFSRKTINGKQYFKEYPPVIDWEIMFVIGIVIGAFISAYISGDFNIITVPRLWAREFGDSFIFRIIISIIGGIFLGFGARLAGGCTSGHGISGAMQMAVSSWVSAIFFFIGGGVTAYLMFSL
ncbi:MAG TPA: YeeE/YedE thiosulfate transporter family protein [Clostridiales bacterium]|nr:YeeE/YedE thiosulfate transporter family protein [Clostridiales bacterium]HQP70835.1 YeeE/YedE thiosulfate transporter family protein [Clostridiales bacterium]